jgi:hypothetical protein
MAGMNGSSFFGAWVEGCMLGHPRPNMRQVLSARFLTLEGFPPGYVSPVVFFAAL